MCTINFLIISFSGTAIDEGTGHGDDNIKNETKIVDKQKESPDKDSSSLLKEENGKSLKEIYLL